MTQLTLRACAKINLGLRVIRRRADGYHDLVTRFQRISLADVVGLTPILTGVAYRGPQLTPDPHQNLCVKAAGRFFERFGIGAGVSVVLTKRIPTGAGLGGGSSNAAAVLRGLAQLHSIAADDPGLAALALELGADVPFFLSDRAAAVGRGLGDDLEVAEGLPDEKWVAVVWPGFQVSTAQAYQELDNTLTRRESGINLRVRSLLQQEQAGRTHYINDFEPVVFSAHPELSEARDRLLRAGAFSAGLAGSGSSLFGLFDGEAEARAAASGWRPPWLTFVCRPC